MILSSVTDTLGKESTVVLALVLWATLIIVFSVLNKKIHYFQTCFIAPTGRFHAPQTFETRFLENKFYGYFFHIFLLLSLVMGIITLYLQEMFTFLLAIVFIFCSLLIFIVYLAILFLFIWKTWWSH